MAIIMQQAHPPVVELLQYTHGYTLKKRIAREEKDEYHPTAQAVTDEALCDMSADDAGNGDAMMALYGKDFLYCGALGWLVYCGTHWKRDEDESCVRRHAVLALRRRRIAGVNRDAENIIRCCKADEKRVSACLGRLKTLVNAPIDTFDNYPDFLNCANGVLDLRYGTLYTHECVQRFTYCLEIAYEKKDASECLDYLRGVVGGGDEVIDYLQMALGYSLTGHTSEEILFYLFGPTRSGKGTLSEIFLRLLPNPLSLTVDFNSFTAKREADVNNFDLADLKASRIVFASESNPGQSLNPAKIKQLTGGDSVRASHKHKPFFTYRPQFKVWMLSNHPVNGDPDDDALWGRVRVIPFPTSYLGKEDKSKKARMKEPEMLAQMLSWCVEGAIKWYALGPAGLQAPEAIREITKEQRSELDYVGQWLAECSEEDPREGSWVSNEEVITSYTQWCSNNNVTRPKSPKALAISLKTKGYTTSIVKRFEGKTRKGVGGLYLHSQK